MGEDEPKVPPDFATLQSKCPQKKANSAPTSVDGCTIPLFLVFGVGGITNQDPLAGVCASSHGSAFGSAQGDVDPSQVNSLPCNQHDRCYQECGFDKMVCDERIRKDLKNVCDLAYPSATCPSMLPSLSCPGGCTDYLNNRARCSFYADGIADGLESRHEAEAAYEADQLQHCDCCP
jgi:hypothetical protein